MNGICGVFASDVAAVWVAAAGSILASCTALWIAHRGNKRQDQKEADRQRREIRGFAHSLAAVLDERWAQASFPVIEDGRELVTARTIRQQGVIPDESKRIVASALAQSHLLDDETFKYLVEADKAMRVYQWRCDRLAEQFMDAGDDGAGMSTRAAIRRSLDLVSRSFVCTLKPLADALSTKYGVEKRAWHTPGDSDGGGPGGN